MKDKRKFKKSLAEKHIEVEDMEEILEQYAVVERQVEKALVGNLDEAVDCCQWPRGTAYQNCASCYNYRHPRRKIYRKS
jgi:hypothetical protein